MSRSGSESGRASDDHVPERLRNREKFAVSLNAEGYADVLVLRRESGREVLTESRLELVQYLDRNGDEIDAVSQLARQLGRDKGAVSKDLRRLAELDVVAFEGDGDGVAKRPVLAHETVVIEPVIY